MINNKQKYSRLLWGFLLFLICCSILIVNCTAQDIDESLYNQKFEFKNDESKSFSIDSNKGQIVLLAMVYTRCKGACPITVQRMKSIEKELFNKGIKINYNLISFDSENDSAAVLKAFKSQYKLDNTWNILTSDPATIRRLSVILGVSYQQDPETKEFSHSNQLIVLDKKGNIAYQLEGLQSSYDELIEKISAL